MISLLDYVGTESRVGKKNNIWSEFIFWFNSGEGSFTELSPNKISFSGSSTFLLKTTSFILQVELLSETRCNVRFLGDSFNSVPYSLDGDIFVANLPEFITLFITRYNRVETEITRTIVPPGGQYLSATWHIQPV